jgi:hypothetical protein
VDAREERLARNETLFREVNEQIRVAAVRHGADEHVYEFFCECSNLDCDFKLSLTVSQYESVRSHSDWFFVAPGHLLPEIEHLVERRDGHDIVAKEGDAARLADELDPRS